MKGLQHKQADLAEDTKRPINPKLVDSALEKLQKPQSMFNSLLFI